MPFAVGVWIGGAYFFTSSTSFANPAVTDRPHLSDTFAGIKPSSAPMFIVMQLIGAAIAVVLIRFLYPHKEITVAQTSTSKRSHWTNRTWSTSPPLNCNEKFAGTSGRRRSSGSHRLLDQFAPTHGHDLPPTARRTLRPGTTESAGQDRRPATERPPVVLFLCVHNAGRSQMAPAGSATSPATASGLVRRLRTGPIRPTAADRKAMAEVGIDITDEFPKPWTDEIVRAADVVVTMGCGDACPLFPGKRYEDWELDDPAGQGTRQPSVPSATRSGNRVEDADGVTRHHGGVLLES